jgi:ankyrin repeat protein
MFYTKNLDTPTRTHSAVRRNLPEMVKLLIENGADVNIQDNIQYINIFCWLSLKHFYLYST